MLKEFKQFALKGNVLDLALGVVIGAAFSKIVTSLVNDLIMPILGLLLGGINFTNLKYVIHPAVAGTLELSIRYGLFIQSIIDFLIIAFSLFIFIKAITSIKKKKAEEVIVIKPSNEELLLTEIRDLLKEKK
ncbi:large-conductance mechanosensitive channel protein MscL [Clostridium tagluense]|uniref:large-conductance mechanosensitive channel protein MscL n=1 Tax=Clostridium tagluense TaxID=360422 RepID=UPI001C0BB591|nr:large-conductance mechanosensitive channel protein MscL [Clostridium tagluense]MBU3127806.1 large-conductance mechanosensitive channel protein MscL [Clostridium tagluense]MCB2310170.1 large-conductance mechanosensitive channel protein MscL [Clostridium tagluense]MCB2315188.1 large-conductance mechanosensitive channel protein MscL [Clostridium tagluense]MCB2319870.1 large-conductance mechanosensitive channel protein MscL [Clostridium tagluense]MCB2324931.1 large-conductance mechanosensitive 